MNHLRFDRLEDLTAAVERMTGHSSDKEDGRVSEIFVQNRHLYEKWDSLDSPEFIRAATLLSKQDASVYEFVETAALAILRLNKGQAQEAFEDLKDIDKTLARQTLGRWIDEHKTPIKELGLTKEQMLKLAPYLTYLDLEDGDYCFVNNQLKGAVYDEEFISSFLSRATRLSFLRISQSTLTGSALEQLRHMPGLKRLEIYRCPHFNVEISDLPSLEYLIITECPGFQGNICNNPNLKHLLIRKAGTFNGLIKDLPILGGLEIYGCTLFNGKLINLPSLMRLIIDESDHFNQPLSQLPRLESLGIFHCRTFNQDLSSLGNLECLIITLCEGFNQNLCGFPKMKTLRVVECPAFNGRIENLSGLERLDMYGSSVFNPFETSVETVRLFMRFDKENTLFSCFGKLSNERRDQFAKSQPALLQEIEESALRKDESGFSMLDYWLAPPAKELSYYAGYLHMKRYRLPISETLSFMIQKYRSGDRSEIAVMDALWKRICERFPAVARGNEENTDLIYFSQKVLDFMSENAGTSDNSFFFKLIHWDYKMNQSLPMTSEGLQRIKRLLDENVSDALKIRLMLQTHFSLEEIESAVFGGISVPFPNKEEFFRLSIQKQSSLLCRAVILRERGALNVANRVLKRAAEAKDYDPSLLQFSIRLLKATGAQGASKSMERLCFILGDATFSDEIKRHACEALAEVECDLESRERKLILRQLLSTTSDPELQRSVIDSLGKYHFTPDDEDIAEALCDFSDRINDDSVKRSIAFTLSAFPSKKALEKSLSIVNSPVWDMIEKHSDGQESIGRMGSFMMYPYRPAFHDSRQNMRRVIAERIVEMNRASLSDEVDERLRKWRDQSDDYPNVTMLSKNFAKIQNGLRYVPFPVFLPPGKVVFRGICARKGDALANAAFYDIIKQGAGSIDLSLLDSFEEATWAKIGQTFTSAALDYVLQAYFNRDGVLMTISSETVNEMSLRRQIRYQHEGAIHPVSYERIRSLTRLFMRKSREEELDLLRRSYVQGGKDSGLKTAEKIAMRQFCSQIKEIPAMRERVSYFNEPDFEMEIKQMMHERGLSEATIGEIAEENIRRQILREILSERMEEGILKECMEFAAKVRPAVIQQAIEGFSL